MKTSILHFFMFILLSSGVSAQLTITEISYNPPEAGDDSLEYVEVYNLSDQPVDMSLYSFTNGVSLDSLGVTIGANAYLVFAKDSAAMLEVFNIAVARQWSSGSLSNGGETITISDANGAAVVSVAYDDMGDWPTRDDGTDANGASIILCDLDADINNGLNWQVAKTSTGVFIDGKEVLGSPGMANGSCDAIPDLPASLVLSEIMYDDPTTDDALEFVELYNNGSIPVSLAGFSFSAGVEHTFTGGVIQPGESLVLAKNAMVVDQLYGTSSLQWTAGDLANDGEEITLVDTIDRVVCSVTYSAMMPWPTTAAGEGYSVVFCAAQGDNADPNLWRAARESTAVPYQGTTVYASPGMATVCELSIGALTTNDAAGLSVYDEAVVLTTGTVHSINFRPAGLEFSIQDNTGEGLIVFSLNDDLGYNVVLGDIVDVEGRMSHFNGLTQLQPTQVTVSGSEALQGARVVTDLSDDTEGELVQLAGVRLIDPSQWTGAGTAFEVEVTDEVNTYVVRIDADTDLHAMGSPRGTFDVSGIGFQFDPLTPYDTGYTLYPRSVTDISPYDPFVEPYNSYDIATVTTVDADGVADSLDVRVSLQGIVYGPNYRPSGLDFTIIDGGNNGIRVFNFDTDLGYVVTEGDAVNVKGRISQRSGLTRVEVDSVTVISVGNALLDPASITAPGEVTESAFVVTAAGFDWVDQSQWRGDGSSFSIDVTDGTNEFALFIDNDNELASQSIPSPNQSFLIRGIGNQFDTDAPFDSGYQISPRDASDILLNVSSTEQYHLDDIIVYPSPVHDELHIDWAGQDCDAVEVIAASGKVLLAVSGLTSSIDVSSLAAGVYFLRLRSGEAIAVQSFIKQ